MPQSLACINVHFIWSTKNRERWITSDLAVRLYPYLGGIVRERGCVLSLVGGMPTTSTSWSRSGAQFRWPTSSAT